MALPRPVPGNTGATLYSITQLCNAADALQAAIDNLPPSISAQINGAVQPLFTRVFNLATVADAHGNQIDATQNALGVEINARTDQIIDLRNRVAGITAQVTAGLGQIAGLYADGRPGDAAPLFTTSLASGAPESLPQLPSAMIGTNENGAVAILTGEVTVARRRFEPLEAGRIYAVSFAVQRRRDTADPSDNTVQLGLTWFDQSRLVLPGASQITVVQNVNELRRADGRMRVIVLVSRTDGLGAQILAPANARFCRPYVHTYGADQQTDLETLGWADVTDAWQFSPDVSGLMGRIEQLEGGDLNPRLTTLEQAVASPRLVQFPTLADAVAAQIPVSVRNIRLLGYGAPDDNGGGYYARSSSPPSSGAYFSTADGAGWVLVDTTIALQQLGGADDAVNNPPAGAPAPTANDEAWDTAKDLGLPIRMPRLRRGLYGFAQPLLLAGGLVEAAPGTAFRAPASADFSSSLKVVGSALKGYFRVGSTGPGDDGDTVDYDYEFSPDHKRPSREKVIWPGMEINREKYGKIRPEGMTHVSVGAGADDWAPAVPALATDHEVIWNLVLNSRYVGSLLPVRGGMDLRWAHTAADYVSGLLVRTTAGYYLITAGQTGAATLTIKLIGQAPVTVPNIGWPGLLTDGAYYPGNAFWGVRVYDNKRFALLINAYRAFGPVSVEGEIIDAGPVFYGDRTASVSASWLNRVFRQDEAGAGIVGLLCVGDSTSEDIHGGWPYVAADLLDGLRGIRVNHLYNYAKGGDAIFQQVRKLQAQGIPPETTHAAVMIGRNDIAGGAPTDEFSLDWMTQLLDLLQAGNLQITVVVPFGAYKRGATDGRGVNVIREEGAQRTQMMIAALAASRNVNVLDMNDVLGPVIGSFAYNPNLTSVLRDNLHPSAYGYKLIGSAIARAVANQAVQPMTPVVADGALPTSSLAGVYGPMNGWSGLGSGDPNGLVYQADKRGDRVWYSLGGQLSPGGRGDQTGIYQLPPNMRPTRQILVPAYSDADTPVFLQIDTGGVIRIRGMGASGSFVRLDGLSYLGL